MFRYLFKEFLRESWREPSASEWNETMSDKLFNEVRKISFGKGLQKAGIIICGPNQSGKSSFINSIMSICEGRQANVVPAMFSVTGVTYQCIRVSSSGALHNFNITDTTGLIEPKGAGLNVEDVIYTLQGKIKNGYEFKDTPISEDDKKYFNNSPDKNDESHCLVIVMDVNLLDRLSEKYFNKLKEIVVETRQKRYPMVLILTKLDTLYPYLRKDITYMFRSSIVKEAVQKASKLLGFQEKNIHPVINYTEELTNNKIKNIPILLALRQILHYAYDKVSH